MYEIEIEEKFEAAHRLAGHRGKCARLHGHNWRVRVILEGREVGQSGMLMDFQDLRDLTRTVLEELDHSLLNEHPAFTEVSPTAENLSRFIFERLEAKLSVGEVRLSLVKVFETDLYSATYRRSHPAS